jgi:aryl-alcohol dehydrogenase-like predicted oxidoreductase
MNMRKIVLGSAQFGMDYGINNKRGRIPRDEVFEILSLGKRSGLDMLDTAAVYGNSEEVIGEYIKKEGCVYDIVSKLGTGNKKTVRECAVASMTKLGVDSLYGYIVHSFGDYEKTPGIWGELEAMRVQGIVRKTGFSLYYLREVEFLTGQGIRPGIVQLPYNVFDRRFDPFLAELHNSGVEIHARSVFLQGLMFKEPDTLPESMLKIKHKLELLRGIAQRSGIPVFALCLNFALHNPYIDNVVVGVDDLDNFKELLTCSEYESAVDKIIPQLAVLTENDEKIVLPVNWS